MSSANESLLWFPLRDGPQSTGLSLSVGWKRSEGAAPAKPLILRDMGEAVVYLAAWTDAHLRPTQLLELWVQRTDLTVANRFQTDARPTNGDLDERWKRFEDTLSCLHPQGTVATGLEQQPPCPLWVDTVSQQVLPTTDYDGNPWKLCDSDEVLLAQGKTAFLEARDRFLYCPALGIQSPLVPLSKKAPKEIEESLRANASVGKEAVLFNSHAGRILVRRFYPLSIEEYLGIVAGRQTHTQAQLAKDVGLGESFDALRMAGFRLTDDRVLMSTNTGAAGHLTECLFLKLSLFADLIECVQEGVRLTGLPFLSLGPESFRVDLSNTQALLPALWTGKSHLVGLPESLPIHLPGTDLKYFLRTHAQRPNVYQPQLPGQQRTRCNVNLHKITVLEDGRIEMEATLELNTPIAYESADLFRVALPLGDEEMMEFFGHVHQEDNLVDTYVRFRSMPLRIDSQQMAQLPTDGALLHGCLCELLPMLGTPCDLYSLAVLGVRIFLSDGSQGLQKVVADLRNLARAASAKTKKEEPLGAGFLALMKADASFRAQLGPHRILETRPDEGLAEASIPLEFWAEILASLAVMFPQLVPQSICESLIGSADIRPEDVFARSASTFRALARQARSLVVVDWNMNRDINSAIEVVAGRLGTRDRG